LIAFGPSDGVIGVWFLFHHNVKTRLVENGESFVDTCPECGRRARFHEVEVSENVGVFFVDILGDKERKYRCSACARVFDRNDDATALPPPKSARELERERAAEQARQLAAQQRRREIAEAKANRIEDELAELKKRLGR
jgi:rubredoxin